MLLRKRKTRLKTAPERYTDDALSSQMYDVPDSRPDPEERYMWDEARQRLGAAIQGLPPQLRSIVHLYYEKERHVKEVAETLGIR
jgi:RNA polymerase sigma factor (sigma-70 family)